MSENTSLNTIMNRVGSLESRMDDHTKRIETRLDDLLQLMQKVTQLQEREARNAEDIKDLRESIKIIVENLERMNQRWHERIDLQAKEMETCRSNLKSSFDGEHRDIEKELKKIEEKIEHEVKEIRKEHEVTKERFDKWFNRGIGAWFVASVLIASLQSWGAYMFRSAMDEVKSVKAQIQLLTEKVKENENSINHNKETLSDLKVK